MAAHHPTLPRHAAPVGEAQSPQPYPHSSLIQELHQTTNSEAIVTEAPEERFRLGLFDSSCLIINRMIGTGIFNSPTTVIQGTRSTGGALLLWFFGMFYGLTGTYVYIEYGLNVPRYVIDGVEQAVPRSGGDLHYLQFVYRWVHYKRKVLLSGCLFGICFICVCNTASNCLSFAMRVLGGSQVGSEPDRGAVRGIAMAVAIVACTIHAVSRRGGIWLANMLAVVKIGILLTIIAMTFAIVSGGVKDKNGDVVPNVFSQNMDPKVAFKSPGDSVIALSANPDGSANGYAAAFLSIIFAYTGFDQANCVLGEIAKPRQTFPRAAALAVGLVSVLYMTVNICYMAVVPASEQSDENVALLFFRKALGFAGDDVGEHVFNTFLALSSLGNIIVTTYTAARMKQEIAKQGFIPFPKFFAQNVDVSIGRLILHLRKTRGWGLRWISAQQHQEPTPVGALLLHLVSCAFLILATNGVPPGESYGYGLLAGLMAYLTSAWFGVFIALGILILRIWGPPAADASQAGGCFDSQPGSQAADPHVPKTWGEMVNGSVYGWLSVICACIYLLGNAFPLIASWVPATARFARGTAAWWVVPVAGWAVLGFASLWWLSFVVVAKYRENYQKEKLVYEVYPEFEWADPAGGVSSSEDTQERRRVGGKILIHETVLIAWEGGEMGMFDPPHSSGGAK